MIVVNLVFMYVDCHHHGHVLVKCEVQLLLVGISSLGF